MRIGHDRPSQERWPVRLSGLALLCAVVSLVTVGLVCWRHGHAVSTGDGGVDFQWLGLVPGGVGLVFFAAAVAVRELANVHEVWYPYRDWTANRAVAWTFFSRVGLLANGAVALAAWVSGYLIWDATDVGGYVLTVLVALAVAVGFMMLVLGD